MARINLLPWREEHRQEKKKEFVSILMLVLLLTGAAAFVWGTAVSNQIDTQRDRNTMLQNDIKLLDSDLKDIKKLKETRKQWLERMEVIQGLQGNRAEIVKLFDELARTVPDGVYFTDIQLLENQIAMTGYAESNVRISTLMRRLDEASKFSSPDLNKIEANKQLGEQGARFELGVTVVEPVGLTGGDGNGGGA